MIRIELLVEVGEEFFDCRREGGGGERVVFCSWRFGWFSLVWFGLVNIQAM